MIKYTPTTQKIAQAEQPIEFAYEPVSQARLIWRRFKRHKLGLIGALIIAFLVFVLIFAEFISPYNYLQSHPAFQYVPPMIGRIHFDGLRPFVYGLKKLPVFNERGQRLPGVWDYQEDTTKKYYIRLFVRGENYHLFSFIPINIHLFGTGEPSNSPGQFFPLGTDNNGHDLLSQILFGGRVTLAIAPLVILVSFLVATTIGGLSGYLGGKVDILLQRFAEVFMSLPRLALLIAIAGIITFIGNIPPMLRFWSIVGLLSTITWAPICRVIRGQFLALREMDFTQAARALGASNARIIFRHIVPNITSYLVVAATLAVPDIVILESILSYLGYGIQHPLISWGKLLDNFQGVGFYFEMQFHAWLLLPAVFIVIVVLAFNFMGDALRDAVDPYTVAEVKESMR